MQVTAEQTDPCTVVLTIDLDEQAVAHAFDSTYREFSRHVNIPGFRPGKAPRAIVERFVNLDRVRQYALDKLLRDSYAKAIEEQGITPYRQSEVEAPDLEDKKPYTYKVRVPLEPQVTLGEYTGLTVEKPIFPVTDAEVEEHLMRLRESRARLERISDRGVEEGDVLIAENQIVLEGEETPAPPRRQLIQVGNNIPGFDAAILGMRPDEERTFTLTYPEDYDEEDKRGKRATFTLRLSSISARKLPELDGAFASQVAGVETVEELRQVLRQRMEADSAQLSAQIAEQRLVQEIVQRATIYYPEVLVHDEVEDKLRQLAESLRERNMSYEQYLTQTDQTEEAHKAQLAAQADVYVRDLLALRQIAAQEGLEASNEAIDAEFERLMNEGRITEDQYDESRANPRRRLLIANALIQQRLRDFLFANNTLREVVQTTSPDPEALAESQVATP